MLEALEAAPTDSSQLDPRYYRLFLYISGVTVMHAAAQAITDWSRAILKQYVLQSFWMDVSTALVTRLTNPARELWSLLLRPLSSVAPSVVRLTTPSVTGTTHRVLLTQPA